MKLQSSVTTKLKHLDNFAPNFAAIQGIEEILVNVADLEFIFSDMDVKHECFAL